MIKLNDCILGILNRYDGTKLVTFKELVNYQKELDLVRATRQWVGIKFYTLKQFVDENVKTDLLRFKYCPHCGEKIPWNELYKVVDKNGL